MQGLSQRRHRHCLPVRNMQSRHLLLRRISSCQSHRHKQLCHFRKAARLTCKSFQRARRWFQQVPRGISPSHACVGWSARGAVCRPTTRTAVVSVNGWDTRSVCECTSYTGIRSAPSVCLSHATSLCGLRLRHNANAGGWPAITYVRCSSNGVSLSMGRQTRPDQSYPA